jgi:hypothetical protein
LSAREAAALMAYKTKSGHPGAVISKLTNEHVYLVTDYYLLPESADPVESFAIVRYGDSAYRVYSASWEGYSNSHRLNRSELEKEIGRPLTDRDVDTSLKVRPASFSSHHVWLYVLCEILFLSLLATSAFVIVQRAKNGWSLFGSLLLLNAAFLVLVMVYSPAFYDADFFHQRVVVENLWLCSFAVLMWIGPLAVAIVPFFLLSRLGRILQKWKAVPARTFWLGSTLILLMAVSGLLLWDFTRYRSHKSMSTALLERVEQEMRPKVISFITGDPGMRVRNTDFFKKEVLSKEVMGEIDRLLDPRSAYSGHALRILVPISRGEEFLFLWAHESFKYADVRSLKTESRVTIIDYNEILEMIDRKAGYSSDFVRFVTGRPLEGRVLLDRNQEIMAICLVDAEPRGGGSVLAKVGLLLWVPVLVFFQLIWILPRIIQVVCVFS